jgi:LmbE family N-acetylglucosaminyl deacetylase
MRRSLVVSPHFDDAVLSCSGKLMDEHLVDVVTVFAALPPENCACPVWDELTAAVNSRARVTERREEDSSALAHFDITPRHLNLLESQYQQYRHHTLDDLQSLSSLVSDYDEVWLPAGIGLHPDHVLVRQAGLAAKGERDIFLYADLPYAVRFGWPSWLTDKEAHQFLDVDRWYISQFRATGLKETLPVTVRTLSKQSQCIKTRAMAEYATQMPALLAGYGGRMHDPAILKYELYWTFC